MAATAVLALFAAGGCGSDDAAEDVAEALGRAKATSDEAYDDLLGAREALDAARSFDFKPLDDARADLQQALTEMDSVVADLQDGDDSAVTEVAAAEKAAEAANEDGIGAVDDVANELQGGKTVPTPAHLAVNTASEALGEAADTVRSAADAVNDWSSAATAADS